MRDRGFPHSPAFAAALWHLCAQAKPSQEIAGSPPTQAHGPRADCGTGAQCQGRLTFGPPRTGYLALRSISPIAGTRYMMNRRNFLKDSLIAAGFAAIPDAITARTPAATSASGSLKAAGAACGLKIGTQAEKGPLQQYPNFAQAVRDNFNLLTPGNELKWPRLRPTPDSFNFNDADWMVNFGQSNGMLIHGHNLCW